MSKRGVRKCKHCRKLFLPDAQNHHRKKYCNKPECRKVCKRESQRQWIAKPENQNYFKDSENVERVQKWRKAHPGYWRKNRVALQDCCQGQAALVEAVTTMELPLQDCRPEADPLIIGMISQVFGTLQEELGPLMVRLHAKGQMILGKGPGIATNKETEHAGKASIAR